jgi:Bacterial regulatory helix-turn-helix protein, lysR family
VELGCPVHTLNRFAHDHGIPVRARSTSIYIPASSALASIRATCPNRSAGPSSMGVPGGAWTHLLIIAGHASILQAARALGIWQSILYQQVARLERACGGPLVHRSPRSAGTGILTPLGQQLCQQAREYLGPQTDP